MDDTSKSKVEYLDWNSVLINRTIHAVSASKILFSSLGKPDSVITTDIADGCGSYFDQGFKYVYIKGNQFEMRGDSIAVSSLDFRKSDLIVTINRLKLDKNTSFESLIKLFPNAVSRKYLLDVYGENEKLTAIMLGVNKDYKQGDTDGVWILLFKDGLLVRMDYHQDC